jgi:hypothetical protein
MLAETRPGPNHRALPNLRRAKLARHIRIPSLPRLSMRR